MQLSFATTFKIANKYCNKLGWLCLTNCSLFLEQVSLDVGFGSTCVLFSLLVLGLPFICLFGAGFNLGSLVMLWYQTPFVYY